MDHLPRLPAYLAHLDVGTLLPTAWNSKDKSTSIELAYNSLQAVYRGAGKTDQDAAAIRSNHAIPAACGLYYYEVEVISKGRDGYMGIGMCWENVPMGRLPGWEPNSYGYHADDGNSFSQTGTGKPYGPTYTTGDIVGCGINFVDHSIFFTKNGVHLGVAFRDVKGTFYPTVGMRTQGEVMLANFGQRPFRYDIEALVKEERARLRAAIDARDLGPDGGYQALNSLLLSYLVHHGYATTAVTLARATGLLPPAAEAADMGAADHTQMDQDPPRSQFIRSDLSDQLQRQLDAIKDRQAVRTTLLDGDIDGAMQLLQRLYPDLLQRHPPILFKLRCRQFVELVRQLAAQQPGPAADEWLARTMAYGQQLQDAYASGLTETQQSTLEETFSLMAYADPHRSPVAHLLDPAGREDVAALVNSAILARRRGMEVLPVYQSGPAQPPLERLLRQLWHVIDELGTQGVGAAAFVSVRNELA